MLRSYLSSALQAKLYTNFYCVGIAVAGTEGRGATFSKAVNSFSLPFQERMGARDIWNPAGKPRAYWVMNYW